MSISQNFPDLTPSLNLNFAGSKKLDSRITFTRGSTGTYMDDNGFIKTAGINEPRFDHSYDGTTIESLGLLIEESRTNLVTDSATDFGYGISTGNTPTNDVAPDGSTVTCKYNLTGSSAPFLNVNVDTSLSPGSYTMSMWLKGSTNFSASFAFVGETNIEIYNNTANITTEWKRFTLSFTLLNSQNNSRLQVFFGSEGENKILSVWGAQLEAGPFATSYIRRSSGSTATRSADNASITGTNFTNWYNSTEGTIFTAARRGYGGNFVGYPNLYAITDGTGNNSIKAYGVEPSPQFTNGVNAGGVTQTDYVFANISTTNLFKSIYTFATNNSTFCVNGTLTTTDTSFTLPTVSRLNIGQSDTVGSNLWNGTIAQISYYPKRLTNTQLQNLTR